MAKMKFKGKDYYQIEKDDDYFKIGKKLFNKYSAAPLIAQANPDFEFLKTGAVISLPENVPDKIMIPVKKKNHKEIEAHKISDAPEAVSAEEDFENYPENALAEVEGNAELDAPLAEMYEDEKEKEPETAIEPVVIEPEAETVPAESILPPDLGDDLTEPTADIANEINSGVPEADGDEPIDLPPTPDDAGENPEVNKDWETIAGMERREMADKDVEEKIEEIKKDEKKDYMMVVEGVNSLEVLNLMKNIKFETYENTDYPIGENIDPNLKPPYVNIWNPIETSISVEGLEFILKWESKEVYPYPDSTKNWTVGYGHKLLPEEISPENLNREYSEEEILELLSKDILDAEKYVRKTFQNLDNEYQPDSEWGNPVPITQVQFDACVSLVLNVGLVEFEELFDLVVKEIDGQVIFNETKFRLQMEGDYSEGGPGVITRRQQELEMFIDGIYGVGP